MISNMTTKDMYTAIGLMSGTSLDGVDAACIRTDGREHVERISAISIPYDDELRASLRSCLGLQDDEDGFVRRTEELMTRFHAQVVKELLSEVQIDVDVIGFHGQTIYHDPDNRFTWQIGDGGLLAQLCGVDVVNDMRSADVAVGGQGAPLLPLYHAALAKDLVKPVAILNIGGVANVTYIGAGQDEIIAFDTGPGNALVDDWVSYHTGQRFDENGTLAKAGQVDQDIVEAFLSHDYFTRNIPKSLDRDEWSSELAEGLSAEDGAATLLECTLGSIEAGFKALPNDVSAVYVTGGGRHNAYLMDQLSARLSCALGNVDDLGWYGDSIEAEGFAYLAVRSMHGLPLSLPTTTGAPRAITGGILHKANNDKRKAS